MNTKLLEALKASISFEVLIHYMIFIFISLLFLFYGLALPAYAVYWSEGARISAGALGLIGVLVGAATFLLRFRSLAEFHGEISGKRFQWAQWRLKVVPARLMHPRQAALELLPTNGAGAGFHRAFARWHRVTLPEKYERPPIYWSLDEDRKARVAGTSSKPFVVVTLGLLRLFDTNPRMVEFMMLHELAHIRHGDPSIFAGIRSYLAAWASSCVATALVCLIDLLGRADKPLYVALVTLAALAWASTLAAALLFLLRYAGYLFSLRELHADVAATLWLGDSDAAAATLAASMTSRHKISVRVKSFFSLRLTHMSGPDRLGLLQNPFKIIMPKIKYFALSFMFAILMQSSPFVVGFGHSSMILFLSFFGWLVSSAMMYTVVGSQWFAHQAGIILKWRNLFSLILLLTLAYELPFMKFQGAMDLIFAPLLGGNPIPAINENVRHVLSSIKNGFWVSVLCSSAFFVMLMERFLKSRKLDDRNHGGLTITSPLVVAITVGTIFYFLTVVLLKWESTTQSPIEDLSDVAYNVRYVLPLVTFGLIIMSLKISIWLKRKGATL